MMAYLQGKSQLIGGCKRGSREGPENLNGCDVLIDCRTTIRVLTGRASQTTVTLPAVGSAYHQMEVKLTYSHRDNRTSY